MRTVHFEPQALKDLRALTPSVAERVVAALNRYVQHEQADVRQLKGEGPPPRFRMRTGDWRVIFEQNPDSIRILRVLHRGRAYR